MNESVFTKHGNKLPRLDVNLHPLSYSKAMGTWSWVVCVACLCRGVREDNLQRPLPTSTILWLGVSLFP